MTIKNLVISSFDHERERYGLDVFYTEDSINRMTNMELLDQISDALETRLDGIITYLQNQSSSNNT